MMGRKDMDILDNACLGFWKEKKERKGESFGKKIERKKTNSLRFETIIILFDECCCCTIINTHSFLRLFERDSSIMPKYF